LRYSDNQAFIFVTAPGYSRGERSLIRVNLASGEMRTWTIAPLSDVVCDTVATTISPDGYWLVDDCVWQGEHYIFILDLGSGAGIGVSPRGYECRDPTSGHFEWDFLWTPENQVLAWCKSGFNQAITCLITPQDSGYQCQRSEYDKVLGLSPDGSMMVLHRELPEAPYYRVFLTDMACLQNRQFCEEALQIYDSPNSAVFGGFAWDNTGAFFVWADVSSTNLQDFSTSAYLVDLDAGSTETLFVGQPGHWSLSGYSPDNQWLLFNLGRGEIVLYSLDSRIVRRIQLDGSFLGWYVVP